MTNLLLIIVSFFFSPFAVAQSAQNSSNIAGTFGSLFAILALFSFLVWVLKKMRITQKLSANSRLKIISQLAVGQRERLAVIDVNGEQILIGITPTQINLLKKLENPIELPAPSTEAALKPKSDTQLGAKSKNAPKEILKGIFAKV